MECASGELEGKKYGVRKKNSSRILNEPARWECTKEKRSNGEVQPASTREKCPLGAGNEREEAGKKEIECWENTRGR